MRTPRLLALFVAAALSALSARIAPAQSTAAVASWIAFDAPPGHEAAAAARLTRALPGWTADRWGNLIRHQGSGSPRRVVACAMDWSAYVVSQVTDDGYLRLRRTGNPVHPLWDQFNEAQRMKVFTARGVRPGVVAVANGHFARQHRADSLAATVDQLWVDIGASSRAEAEKLGVALLDPVMPDRPLWTYSSYAAGPAAGARAGCAAVASAAAQKPASGETISVISTQRIFGWVGLAAALSALGPVDQLSLVDAGRGLRVVQRLASARLPQPLRALNGHMSTDDGWVMNPAVRFAGSLVESIDSTEANTLLQWVSTAAGLGAPPSWVALPVDSARHLAPRADALGALETGFMQLADLAAVSGHEAPVRAAVLAALPRWARDKATVDSAGNVVVAAGPARDAVAFIAHMDEVGWEVLRILGDGRVTLRSRGGAVIQSWEGVPAWLHFDAPGAEPLRGIFVPRDSGRTKAPAALTAWFGMDSAQLAARGVRPGLSLTAYKRADRLAGARITGRASDDRTGTLALLSAVRELDPAALPRRTYFVWTVQEESGLDGARAFGNAHGTELTRVYSIDTFVSSDTPLESRHFAYAPLGGGAVLRGLDDGTLAPRADRERIVAVARAQGIPLQVGTTQGATDGSSIAPWGASNVGLSWPGRYSHGPAEVLDLRDVQSLVRLVKAMALAP
ncbi:MAG: M20/M25/M40 family metallo-hydrolase [Gemmatimonadaceae bacterium]